MRMLLLGLALALALAATAAAGSDGHVKAALVQVNQLPHGGTNIHVVARGLTPGATYTSFYYDDHQCSVGPEEVGTYTANASGVGTTSAKIDDDLDEVGSVSVRTPDYSTLFSC